MFENFDQKNQKKKHFWAKISVFWAKNAKIFKNKKLFKESEKTFPRYTYLDGFGKFLVIFVQKYILFVPMLKQLGAKKSLFGEFSKIRFLAENLTISIDSLLNFLSKNVYFTLLVFKVFG